MTQVVIWLIAFALILALTFKRWESVSPALDRVLPDVLKSRGENRTVWGLALAILGATVLVRPVDILLTVVLAVIIALVGIKLAGWVMNKVDLH
ncbi:MULTISPECIES: hypothetical protein [Halomonas]|jgi:Flp pilus assembly protein TadB|uniref:Uncharacterized protein n=1 Tax=Halomonas mongoliensis TaxID=321265 RepID=A0ABU1GHL6_9GAMM|nr:MULTISPECIES: hypothetical protein [Halomonas]MDR5891495.1 hypothetical protein [Halomonas mongoliensis]